MKIKNALLYCLTMLCFDVGYAQDIGYSALLIPDNLKVNANAVVRYNKIEVTLESSRKQVVKQRRIVTVLNELGNKHIDLYEHYNDDTKINKLSAKVYDAVGNELKKFSEGKFTDVSAVSGGTLYSDAKVKFIDYTPTTYPYTVVFESETENSSTGFIPRWYPVNSYSLSVQKSIYIVNNPLVLPLKKKERNLDGFQIEDSSTENKTHYTLSNQKAIQYERSSLAYFNISPSVWLALNDFTLKKIEGEATNWKEFGVWMQKKLLEDKVVLEEATKATVRDLVKEAKTDKEKAKIVYEYMQNKTRYISVQVGIGGWEPISAKEVDKLGYGDCKGLSNYMKALLLAVGVASNYTIVYADTRRDIDTDFASIQGNHAMLHVPNGEEDIWLECTSQTIPFGFLGRFTEDRNVLVITPEGGVIKRTPAYENETNLQTVNATIVLGENGNVKANIERISKGVQYSDKYRYEDKSKEDLEKYYLSDVWDYNNNLTINSVNLKNDKENVVFTEELKVEIDEYAVVNADEYLFRVNVFNRYAYIPKRYRTRKQKLEIDWGFLDEDAYTIKIPEGYKIDGLPTPKEIKNKFGVYKVSLEKIDNETLVYRKYFLLKKGIHPKEEYKNYRSFLKAVAKYENLRIALQKK